MSRDIHEDVVTNSQSDHVRPFIAGEFDYPDGMVYVTSLPFNITVDEHVYMGVHVMGGISEVKEGGELKSYGIKAELTGVPSSFAIYLINQKIQGRSAVIKLGLVDEKDQIIGNLVTIFAGRMDTQDCSIGATMTSVQVAIESILIDWERARVRRYTDVDQRARFPDDLGLQFVGAVANMELKWGRT